MSFIQTIIQFNSIIFRKKGIYSKNILLLDGVLFWIRFRLVYIRVGIPYPFLYAQITCVCVCVCRKICYALLRKRRSFVHLINHNLTTSWKIAVCILDLLFLYFSFIDTIFKIAAAVPSKNVCVCVRRTIQKKQTDARSRAHISRTSPHAAQCRGFDFLPLL